MSDFLMVVPPEWTEVNGDIDALLDAYGGEASFQDSLSQGQSAVDTLIEPLGLPPLNMTVTDSRLFKDGGTTRLWVQYGPTGN